MKGVRWQTSQIQGNEGTLLGKTHWTLHNNNTIGKMFVELADEQILLGTFSLLVTGFVTVTSLFALIGALRPCRRHQCHI